MKNKKFKIISYVLMLIAYAATVKASNELSTDKGFYFGINPGFSYLQSFDSPISQNAGYGLGFRLGMHSNNHIIVYGFADTMGYFIRSEDDFSASLDIGPAIKYNFHKSKNWFLTGGLGTSFAVVGSNDSAGGKDSLFVSAGIGYDFNMGKKLFVSPEFSLKFYTNQNENHPFSFGTRNGIDQAIQAKISVNFGWCF